MTRAAHSNYNVIKIVETLGATISKLATQRWNWGDKYRELKFPGSILSYTVRV
jgi:hypothetical protein